MSKWKSPADEDQLEIFEAVYADIPIRDQRDTMERPFFSLAKKPRYTPIDYCVGDVFVKIRAVDGICIATIWDADILIWAATQIVEAMDRGETPSRRLEFHPYTLLKAIRRPIGGDHYKRLEDACRRLKSTYVETNIGREADGDVDKGGFSWIDRWGSVKRGGKVVKMTITLSDWFYSWVTAQGGVLSIHEDYFLLTGGIERWLYRVARKHAGNQGLGWTLSMRQLYEKSGSAARLSDFALDIRRIVAADNLPEYALTLTETEQGEEAVTMVRRCMLDFQDPRFEPARRRLGNGRAKALPLPG
jgi:plasmid replication initiation protein